MPLILSEFIGASNKHWELLLLGEEVVDLILPFTISDDTLDYFSETYFNFLTLFKKLYPSVPIKPKLHFLVHFASMVRKNGPPRVYWTMAYERLNGKIKQPCHSMRNYRDPQ